MDIIANELSIHGQFRDRASFRASFAGLVAMRQTARRWNREVYCSRQMADAEPMPGVAMRKAVGTLAEAERRSIMVWLTRGGPFWEDLNRHAGDEWLESGDDIVTDTSVGEAAYRSVHGVDTGLVSVTPSKWTRSPILVAWRRGDDLADCRTVKLSNWWETPALESALEAAAPPLASWHQLREVSASRFDRLLFSESCFGPLAGVPFAKGAADRLALCFGILNRLAGCFDASGRLTPEGHQLIAQYFRGANAIFSDSSTTEKNKFRRQLTFPDPRRPEGQALFGWHGKMRRHAIRFHFSWPVRAGEPMAVVYVGPKITKK